jgi:hypothetical protein
MPRSRLLYEVFFRVSRAVKKKLRGAAIAFSYRLVQFARSARDRLLSFEIGGADAENPPRLLCGR